MDARRDDDMTAGSGGGPGAELAALEAMLDRLGEAERAGAPRGLEGRLALAVRGEVGAAQTEGAVAALAAGERASAGAAFEDRVFMATRAYLRGGTGGATGAGRAAREVDPAPGAWRIVVRASARLAAAAAVIAVVGLVWIAVRPAGPDLGPEEEIAAAPPLAPEAGPEESVVQLTMLVDERLDSVLEADWSLPLPDGLDDLSRDMESLSQQVRGELFQFGVLADEEAM